MTGSSGVSANLYAPMETGKSISNPLQKLPRARAPSILSSSSAFQFRSRTLV